ncbi:MAG TPA: Holliday junction branch migration protein RuvA [Rhodospirillales bacterium]|nr:Holliday junction branch migration protein RuvA [Rhodospirillales bacterium]
MIGRLRGILLEKSPPFLLLDVQGVGYEVEAPMSTFYQLPATGEEVMLHTHLIVREDAQLLCGFASESERRLFRSLIRVNGVGAKLALAILSGMSADEFAAAVQDEDAVRLTRLPGVGKKTAERLIVEMRDRLADWQTGAAPAPEGAPVAVAAASDPVREAITALVSLGYRPAEASRMVEKVDSDGLGSEDIIREALKASLAR